MGTKAFECPQERTFAQNVTRTHYSGTLLFYISLYKIMLYTRLNQYSPVTKLSFGLLPSQSIKGADSAYCTRSILMHAQ